MSFSYKLLVSNYTSKYLTIYYLLFLYLILSLFKCGCKEFASMKISISKNRWMNGKSTWICIDYINDTYPSFSPSQYLQFCLENESKPIIYHKFGQQSLLDYT